MLIIHIIFYRPHANWGCYGNGNSQNVTKIYGSRDNSKTIQASLMIFGM